MPGRTNGSRTRSVSSGTPMGSRLVATTWTPSLAVSRRVVSSAVDALDVLAVVEHHDGVLVAHAHGEGFWGREAEQRAQHGDVSVGLEVSQVRHVEVVPGAVAEPRPSLVHQTGLADPTRARHGDDPTRAAQVEQPVQVGVSAVELRPSHHAFSMPPESAGREGESSRREVGSRAQGA